MSNYGRFLSGKQRDLGIGISNYSEGKTVLNVIGNVAIGGSIGIGTTSRFDLTADVDTRTIRVRKELYDFTGSSGLNNQLLVSIGGTSVKWATLEDVSSFQGITIQDEGVLVGGALSTRTINFVGAGISAVASGTIATVTVDQVTAAGFDGQIQYNNNGDFGGAQTFYYNDSTLRVGIGSTLMSRTLDVSGDVGISSYAYVGRAYVSLDNILPIAPEELASKSYVDNFTVAGLTVQKAVSAATTTAINAYYDNVSTPPSGVGAKLWGVSVGVNSVDGYFPIIGDRILIKNQGVGFGSTAQNGYYTVTRPGNISTSFEYVRVTDFDEPEEITAGAFSFVIGGDVNAGGGFVLITKGTVSVGNSAIEFTQFSSPGEIIAGDGLVKTGNVIDAVSASSSRIVMNPDSIDLALVSTSRSNLTSGTGSFISGLTVDSYGRVSGVITSNTHTLATSSVKGIASFDTPAFSVASGAVGLASTSSGGAAVLFVDGTPNQIDVTRDGGREIVGLTNNVTVQGNLTVNGTINGNGTGLTGLSAGVGVAKSSTLIGVGATILNFTGIGVSTISFSGTTATINIPGGKNVDDVGNANQVLYKNSVNVASGSANLTFNGTNLVCGGTVTANSDESLKENIKTIDGALEKVQNLRGVEFDYKSDKTHSIGLIAQEVEKVLPDLVHESGDGIKSVAYQNIVAVLIEAVKEQQNQIDSLKLQIKSLKDFGI